MVRTARAASAAVAGDERPVGHPGQRGHAPANPGGARRGPLGVLHGALADARGVRCRAARSGAARMAGSRLPAPSPGPSRHGRGRRCRRLARHRSGAADPAGCRRVHGPGAAGPRLRRFGDPAPGRQHHAGHRSRGTRQGASGRSPGFHRGAARRRAAAVAEFTRLHVCALRCGRAPLQGETVVPGVPADVNLRLADAALPRRLQREGAHRLDTTGARGSSEAPCFAPCSPTPSRQASRSSGNEPVRRPPTAPRPMSR